MLNDFFDGITSYGKAITHVNKYKLWAFVLLPGLLCIVVGIGVFGLAWSLSDNIGDIIDNLWKWDWASNIVAKIAQVFGGLLVFILGMIVFRQMVMVISAPFMSILSEKVENQLVGRESGIRFSIPQALSDLARGLRIAVRNIVRELSMTVLLLLLGLIPIFSPFTAVLVFVVQAYFAGFGNIDFALERHFRYKESIRFVQNNRMLAIGNGAVFMFLLLTFIGFPLALPLGTVAATIETTKRLAK